MTIALNINLTDEEKSILSKARELTDKLGDTLRDITNNVTGLEDDIMCRMGTRADLCDRAFGRLDELCEEFEID
jgi:hypothetical protein